MLNYTSNLNQRLQALFRIMQMTKCSFEVAYYCEFSDYPTVQSLNNILETAENEGIEIWTHKKILLERQKLEIESL